jgi:hypothetical protein
MNEQALDMLWIVIACVAISICVILSIVILAWHAFSDKNREFVNYKYYLSFLDRHGIRSNIPKYLNEACSDYLQMRNEF